jgi:RNA-binding protein YhbY
MRADVAHTLCDRLGAEKVQSIGRVVVIYRQRPQVTTAE